MKYEIKWGIYKVFLGIKFGIKLILVRKVVKKRLYSRLPTDIFCDLGPSFQGKKTHGAEPSPRREHPRGHHRYGTP